jgi:hypothetical protein
MGVGCAGEVAMKRWLVGGILLLGVGASAQVFHYPHRRLIAVEGLTDVVGDLNVNNGNLSMIGTAGSTTSTLLQYETITLSTSGTTTNSTNTSMLPAGSVIDGVTCYVNTTITTATNWSVGDATTSTRFCSAQTGMGAGTEAVCLNHLKGGVSTDATGPTQAANAALRITTTGTPGAGKISCAVTARVFGVPTS